MKVIAKKKTASIQLETKEEVTAFALAMQYYMTMVYQNSNPEGQKPDSHYDCDDLIRDIDKKFNKPEKA